MTDNHKIARRDLLGKGLGLAAGALLTGCGGGRRVGMLGEPAMIESREKVSSDEVVLGLYPRTESMNARAAVREVCQRLDWSWLLPGDSVFIKLTTNGSKPHPAATSPQAVRAVVAELQARGAGRILVGDQCGVEYVRSCPGGKRFSSTRERVRQNGLYESIIAAGAEPYFFDEQDYETGYIPATALPSSTHWSEPPRLARIIQQVDHIIYLPRLSSHVLAGYTHGHKIAVGWMREDSRFRMHTEADSFHAKFVEVNYVPELRDRRRLVITLAERLLLDVGPDKGEIIDPEASIVIASSHLANHDTVATAVFSYVDRKTAFGPTHIIPPPYGDLANFCNWYFVSTMVPQKTGIPWGRPDPWTYRPLARHHFEKGIAHDLALSRAYEILGGVPASIAVRLAGGRPKTELRTFLEQHDGGRLRLCEG